MPQGRHGITGESSKRIFLDAGAVYFNYGNANEILLGATRDGSTFELDRTLREMEVDGALGRMKGFTRREEVLPQLVVNMLELTVDNFIKAVAGAVYEENVEVDGRLYTVIKGGEILDTVYIENVALVGTLSGKQDPIIIILKNVIADNGFDLDTAHRDEAVPEVTFLAHFDPENPDEEPWEIRYPQDEDTTT